MLWISVSVEISIVNKSSSTPDADSGQTDYLSRSRSGGGVNTVANGVILLFVVYTDRHCMKRHGFFVVVDVGGKAVPLSFC